MDQRTLAFINLYAVLGTLPELCRLSPQAQAYIRNQNVRLGIAVKGGPAATLVFENSTCRLEPGADNCTIKLPFSSPEKFNGMIDGTVTPIPTKGFTKIGFLTGNFIKLTDLLTRYLRASEEDLANEQFFETSTRLMFHLIVEAIAQIGNEDPVGQASASYIVGGKIQLSISTPQTTYKITLYTITKEPTVRFSFLEKVTAITSTPSIAPPLRIVKPLPTPEIIPPNRAHSSRS